MPSQENIPKGEILLYQTEDGSTRIDVRLQDETLWLTQMQMAELFQKDKRTISEHIANVYKKGELLQKGTVRKFRTVQKEGSKEVNRELALYNLDMVISVGYRVNSIRGTQFRIWATQRLREYLIKGFALDDERLKKAGGGNYFGELLARIRDIRSSEKVFWRKVLDIYATSIDYAPDAEASKQFFRLVQNKMHWATHGKTAAEVIAARVNAARPNMGLTSWAGSKLARSRELLTHAGKISHQQAIDKAHAEYEKYRALTADEPSLVEQHFIEAVQAMKQLEARHQEKKED